MSSSRKIWNFFSKKQKIQSFFLIILILIVTNLEIIGISSFFPVITAILDYDSIKNYPFIYNFSEKFSQKDFIFFSLFLIVVIFLTKNFLSLFLIWFQNRFVLNLQLELVNKVYNTYLNADYIFHTKTNSAHLVRNINSEISHTKFYINTNFNLIVDGLLLIAIFFVVVFLEPHAVFFTTLFVGILTIILYFFTKKKLNIIGKNKIFYEGMVNKTLISSLQGIKELQILDKQEDFHLFLIKSFSKLNKLQLNFIILTSMPRIFLEVIIVFSFVTFLTVLMFMEKNITEIIPTLAIFSISFVRILPSITKIIQNLQFRKYHKPSFDLIFSELEILKNIKFIQKNKKPNIEEFEIDKLDIFIDKISFNYPGSNKQIFADVDVHIKHGEIIGIVGTSGSGKTTFIDCILGLLKPQSGRVLCNNVDIHSNIPQWQKKIGYVAQSVFLLDTTLEKNVAFELGDVLINTKSMNYSLEASRLLDLKKELSISDNPNVGENGARISGGQRQRIGIARALYRNAAILILDEATNSLDKKTENEILDVVKSLKKQKTIFIISHDREVLKNCDRVLSINNGSIKEINL